MIEVKNDYVNHAICTIYYSLINSALNFRAVMTGFGQFITF